MTTKRTAEARADGWENTITGIGRCMDKRSGTRIKAVAVEGSRDRYDAFYHGDDSAATIAELPAKEMTREWITLQVDDSVQGESGVRAEAGLDERALTAKQIIQALDDLSAKSVFCRALLWARVHGGSLVFLGVDDGVEDLAEPLNVDAVRSLDFLTVFDRWEAQIISTVTDIRSPDFGKPEVYLLIPTTETGVGAASPATMIHASRFIRFEGTLTSRYRMALNSGWSDSVYTRVEEVLRDYGSSWASVAHLIQDFSQAVFKMQGLHDAIVQNERNLVLDRMLAMDMCRSVARAVPLDAESESFERVATPLTGLSDVLDRMMLRLSSAARIPATLLFGQSPAGLNATGESDIRLFYDHIKAEQEETLRPRLDRLLDVLLASREGPTRGVAPENWSYTFDPLWQETDKQRAETRKLTAETDAIYIADGVLDPDEVAQSRFGGDAWSSETILDTEARTEGMGAPSDGASEGDVDTSDVSDDDTMPSTDVAQSAAEGAAALPQATLNGAQIAALADTVKAVIAGELPRDTGVQIVSASFPLDPARVERLFRDVEKGSAVVPVTGLPPFGDAAPTPFSKPGEGQGAEGDDDDEGAEGDDGGEGDA